MATTRPLKQPELAVTARLALPCDERGPLRDPLLLVASGRIIAIEHRRPATMRRLAGQRRIQVVDLGNAVILPGLVNAHTHLEFTACGPLNRPCGFTSWIEHLAAWSRRASSEQRLASARAGARMVLGAGITCVGDIVSRGQGLAAMLELGLRGVGYVEFVGGYTGELDSSLVELAKRVRQAEERLAAAPQAGLRLGFSPHAPYTVAPTALLAVSALARRQDWPLAIHLAESADELSFLSQGRGSIAAFMGRTLDLAGPLRPAVLGHSPLSYAATGGLLDPQPGRPATLLIHCVHLGADDVRRLTGAPVAVALCPRSNRLLSVGAEAPVAELARTGIPLAVGTDSLASNTELDLFEELRALRGVWLRQQPAADPGPVADRLLRIATIEGAKALGLDAEIGSLTVGKRADFTITEAPSQQHRLAVGIIDELRGTDVIATFTDGQCRYWREATATHSPIGSSFQIQREA